MSNYPDDWGSYYSRCVRCGGRRHASGDEDCSCGHEHERLEDEESRLIGEIAAAEATGLNTCQRLALAVELGELLAALHANEQRDGIEDCGVDEHVMTESGGAVPRRALQRAADPAESLHGALQRASSEAFVSLTYVGEKAQRVVDALRSIGVWIR